MSKLYLNGTTNKLIDSVIKNLPQSLLITGLGGVGLTTIASYIAEKVAVKPTFVLPEKDDKINTTQGSIGVETMRQLSSETSTKSSGRRIIIIDYAETMTTQAQNAFLKLLEEPSEQLHFILVSNNPAKLLPTIQSRVETITIKPVSTDQTKELLNLVGVSEPTKLDQLLFLAVGLPAEATRLATDEEYFNRRVNVVKDARQFLTGTLYQRLMIIHKYKDDRPAVRILLDDSAKMLEKSLIQSPKKETIRLSDKLIKAIKRVETNGNIRLCLAQVIV